MFNVLMLGVVKLKIIIPVLAKESFIIIEIKMVENIEEDDES